MIKKEVIDYQGNMVIDKQEIIEVPDGGYGWVVVFGNVCLNAAAASTATYSIYLAHYLEYSSFANATKLDYSAIGGIQLGSGFTLAPFIGIIVEKIGVRQTIIVGALLTFLGYFLSGFVKELWQLYLTQGLLVGLGYGFIFVPAYALIPQWFRKKRSWAVSITTSGAGVSGILFNLSSQAIIKNLSLKWAYIIQSILCLFLCSVGIVLIRTRDKHIKHDKVKIIDFNIMKKPIFLVFTIHVFMVLQGYSVLLLGIADFVKTLGFNSTQASIATCMISVGFLIGRPAVGKIADYKGIVTTTIVVYIIVCILCFAMWIPIRNYASVLVFSLFQGLLSGSIWLSLSPITSRIFGLKSLRNALNMLWTTVGISSVIAPIIGLELRGTPSNGSLYSPTQYINTAIYCGSTYFLSVLCLWIIRGYLIARDEIIETKSIEFEDNDELHINVDKNQVFKAMFKLSKSRLV